MGGREEGEKRKRRKRKERERDGEEQEERKKKERKGVMGTQETALYSADKTNVEF